MKIELSSYTRDPETDSNSIYTCIGEAYFSFIAMACH